MTQPADIFLLTSNPIGGPAMPGVPGTQMGKREELIATMDLIPDMTLVAIGEALIPFLLERGIEAFWCEIIKYKYEGAAVTSGYWASLEKRRSLTMLVPQDLYITNNSHFTIHNMDQYTVTPADSTGMKTITPLDRIKIVVSEAKVGLLSVV